MTQTPETLSSAWWKLPWWAILIIAAFLAMALFGDRGVLRLVDVSRQKDLLQQEIAKVSVRTDKLAEDIRGLRSDKRFIEDIARRDLGMARSNEIIYVFPPQEPASSAEEFFPSGSSGSVR